MGVPLKAAKSKKQKYYYTNIIYIYIWEIIYIFLGYLDVTTLLKGHFGSVNALSRGGSACHLCAHERAGEFCGSQDWGTWPVAWLKDPQKDHHGE